MALGRERPLANHIDSTRGSSHALELGGHLKIGLEDQAGERVLSNEELVAEAVALCAEVGRPVATCAQAAEVLDLPRR